MTSSEEKLALLRQHGYRYNFYREIYVNRDRRRAFSREAVDDNPIDWLKQRLDRPSGSEWEFCFNEPPAEEVRREIQQELEQ